MNILVTGSKGFIGRHAVEHFRKLGHTVWGVDTKEDPDDVSKSVVDCRQLFTETGADYFDVVLHFAANIGGREGIDNTPLWVAETLALDAAMFQWADRAKKKPYIIYPSSSAAYPTWLQNREDVYCRKLKEADIDLEEEELGTPDAMYGWVKLTGEKLASYSNCDVGIIRPMSGYGSDQGTEYPFGAYLQRAWNREDPFYVWGDGLQVRDWIHVDDIMEMLALMVEERVTGAWNMGTGIETDFLTLADKFTKAVGYSPEIVPLPDKPVGVTYRVADVTKMNTLYTAKISIDEGISRAIQSRS